MDIEETPAEARFRQEIRSWAESNLAPLGKQRVSFADRLAADRRMAEAGYLGYAWPEQFGGGGGNPIYASILDEECSAVGMPRSLSPSRFGVNLLGPVLMAYGSDELKSQLLPPILKAEQLWCQGFSEPEAGSDLANVRSFAIDNGDHFLLNGSKVWTTQAHEADWCFALVRTDREAPRHKGLSFVVFRMDQEGVTIRPIRQMTGDLDFSEVFFDDVRVEKHHVVGALGEGWRVAMATVGAERSFGQMSRFSHYVSQLQWIASTLSEIKNDPRLDMWQAELGQLVVDVQGVRDLSFKTTSLAAAEEGLGVLPSIAKIWWSTTHNRLLDLAEDVAVATGRDTSYWYTEWLRSRAETIFAGSSEVQRNIISERGLGLPR